MHKDMNLIIVNDSIQQQYDMHFKFLYPEQQFETSANQHFPQ